MKSQRLMVGVFVVGVLSLGATSAFAHNATSPDGGSNAYSSSKTLFVADLKGDSHAAYGFANNTGNRLNNNSGANTTVFKNVGALITAVQACTNIQLSPDSCSDWK